jgi:hypothetical protein
MGSLARVHPWRVASAAGVDHVAGRRAKARPALSPVPPRRTPGDRRILGSESPGSATSPPWRILLPQLGNDVSSVLRVRAGNGRARASRVSAPRAVREGVAAPLGGARDACLNMQGKGAFPKGPILHMGTPSGAPRLGA